MTVKNGELVNEDVTNAGFISRKEDSDTIAVVTLNNSNSATVNDTQLAINKAFDTSGIASEIDAGAKNYSSNNYIANGDDRKVAIGKIDSALKNEETQRQAFDATKGQPNGFAPLDGSGLVPASYLPTAGLNFRGTWDANVNSPDLTTETKNASDFWIVSVAGTTDLGGGPGTDSWDIGDWAIWDGTDFYKIDNSDTVISVNGQTGAVTLDADDIAETATRYWDVKNARNESTDPDANDDSTANYVVGSTWFNSTTGVLWLCQDNTAAAAVWAEVQGGGGAGGTGFNYIANPGAEDDLAGWDTYADTPGDEPVTGTAGSPTSTFTRNTTTPLRGTADFKWSKDASNRLGEGFSYDISLDNTDKASVLRISFDYSTTANYVDGDMRVFIKDTLSGDLLAVTPLEISGNSLNGAYVGEFQTSATSGGVRLIVHTATTNANAYDVHFDNFIVSPRVISSAPVVLDWESASVGWGGTNGTVSALYKRNGDTAHWDIDVVMTGVPAGSIDDFTLTGIFADEAKLSRGSNIIQKIGSAHYRQDGIDQWLGDVMYDGNSGGCKLRLLTLDGSDGSQRTITPARPFSWTTGDSINLKCSYPVSGWGNASKTSDNFGSRVISAKTKKTVTQSIPNSVWTTIAFDSVQHDTTGSMSGSTFTTPSSGKYRVSGSAALKSSGFDGSTEVAGVAIAKNGVKIHYEQVLGVSSASNATIITTTTNLDLVAGDLITIECVQTSGSPINMETFDGSNGFAIEKIQSPETIVGSEIVAMRVEKNNAQAIGTSAILLYNNKAFDTHNSYNTGTGLYTVPVSGVYEIKGSVLVTTSTDWREFDIEINGTATTRNYHDTTGVTEGSSIYVSTLHSLNRGDTIGMRIKTPISANTSSFAPFNIFTVHKVN